MTGERATALDLVPHPVAAWFPMMSEDELVDLADDIAQNGMIEPVVLHGGLVVDGRNRLRACEIAGLDPDTREWEGDPADLASWIISRNLHRRHLTTSQRAMIAARLAERPADGTGHDPGKFAGVPTQAAAADLVGVSERSVRDARVVLDDPDLTAKVEAGEVSVSAAAARARSADLAEQLRAEAKAGPDGDEGRRLADQHEALAKGASSDPLSDRPACGAVNPATGRPCTEPAGHQYSHGYMDGALRCGWFEAKPALAKSSSPPAPAEEAERADLEPDAGVDPGIAAPPRRKLCRSYQLSAPDAPRDADGYPFCATCGHTLAEHPDPLKQELRESAVDDQEDDDRVARELDDARRAAQRAEPVPPAQVSASPDYDGDEWSTPDHIIDAAREVLVTIDLDPATNAFAQARIRAKTAYTKEDDGLSKKWQGRVWLNPPYSQPLVWQFTGRVVDEYDAGRVTAAIVLVNCATDTAWCQALLARFPACFFRGRIKFLFEGKAGNSPRNPQVAFYLGRETAAFVDRFRTLGTVVVPTVTP